MILLAGYFISIVSKHITKLITLTLIALLCSWFGDTFLMFQENRPIFFILGLSSFLLAHIAYILIFYSFRGAVSKTMILIISLLFVSYSFALSYLLWHGLGDMKFPVIIYSLVLTFMGIVGVIKNLKVNNVIVIGVVLFIISDSLLAYTKFVDPIVSGKFLIMTTYILAQFLIIKGISQRILSVT